MTTKEMQEFVHNLMRGIDKKTELTVALRSDTNEPVVTVQLRNAKRTASLQLSEADLFVVFTALRR